MNFKQPQGKCLRFDKIINLLVHKNCSFCWPCTTDFQIHIRCFHIFMCNQFLVPCIIMCKLHFILWVVALLLVSVKFPRNQIDVVVQKYWLLAFANLMAYSRIDIDRSTILYDISVLISTYSIWIWITIILLSFKLKQPNKKGI